MTAISEKTKPLSIKIEFIGHDLQSLERIYRDESQNYLKHLACVAAHLKLDEREDYKSRNKAILSIRRAVQTLRNVKGILHSDEYPAALIDQISVWADSLRQVTFKQSSDSEKQYITPKESTALSAISALMGSKGLDINLNPQREETGSFLTISEIVFRAAGQHTDIEALAKRAQRIIEEKGELSNFSDGIFLYPPSIESMICDVDWSYKESRFMKVVFSYRPLPIG